MKFSTKIQLAVFDMAGTTVSEGGIVYQTIKETIAGFGYPVSDEQIKAIAGMSKTEAVKSILTDFGINDEQKFHEVYGNYDQKLIKKYQEDEAVKEMPGASELFVRLKEQNIKVALNTGYSRVQMQLLIDRIGWQNENLIDFAVAGSDVEQGRPKPYMIRRLMADARVSDPGTVMKVGDSVNDILEGKNAECGLVIGITTGASSREMLIKAGADVVIDQLSEISPIIEF